MKIKNPLNKVLFRRKKSIYIPYGKSKRKDKYVEALNVELAQLGYTLSKELIERFKTLSKEDFTYHMTSLIRLMREHKGADKEFRPLFTKFPNERPVREGFYSKMLYVFDILPSGGSNMEILSCGHIIDTSVVDLELFGACPVCEQQVPELLRESEISYVETTPLEIVNYVEEDEVYTILNTLLSMSIPFGDDEKDDILTIIENGNNKKIRAAVPSEIMIKENFAWFYTKMIEEKPKIAKELMKKAKIEVNDLLRILAVMNDGDVSLAKPFKIVTFPNAVRKMFMDKIEKSRNAPEDMAKYIEVWKRVGERLHPCAYKRRYPETCKVFSLIRSGEKIITFNFRVEQALKNNDVHGAVGYLARRPGEFVRRLDHLLRLSREEELELVIDTFEEVVENIKTKDLIFLDRFFQFRKKKTKKRFFVPKGDIANLIISDKELPALKGKVVDRILSIIEKELINRLKEDRDPINVYIDPKLKRILVPKNLRDISKGSFKIGRGSRIPFEFSGKTLRMFLYWKGGVDLDLSAILLGDKDGVIDRCSYMTLESKYMKHSGDIRSAPKGGAEFVDINLKDTDARYVVPSVIAFTGNSLEGFDTAVGFMDRKKERKGSIFDPRAVKVKVDIEGNKKAVVPFIYDMKEKELIHTDIFFGNNSYGNIDVFEEMFFDIVDAMHYMQDSVQNMYRLIELTAKANGDRIIDDPGSFEGELVMIGMNMEKFGNAEEIRYSEWIPESPLIKSLKIKGGKNEKEFFL